MHTNSKVSLFWALCDQILADLKGVVRFDPNHLRPGYWTEKCDPKKMSHIESVTHKKFKQNCKISKPQNVKFPMYFSKCSLN